MVYQDGQFFSMSRDDFTDIGVDVPNLDRFDQPSPVWVSVDISEDPTIQSELRRRALQTNQPLRTMSELYIPFNPEHLEFDKDPTPTSTILDRDRDTQDVPRWLADHGGQIDDYAFYRFGARYQFIFIGVDKATHKVKGILTTPA
jgi:hypothetical protein